MLHRWSLSYIIVQPEFSVPVGMRNRLSRAAFVPLQIRVWHNPPCQWGSHSSDRMSLKQQLILPTYVVFFTSMQNMQQTPQCCITAFICRSEAILLNLGSTLHSYCVPCHGRMGQEGMCYVGSFQNGEKEWKKEKGFLWNKMALTAWGQAYGPHTAHYHFPAASLIQDGIQLLLNTTYTSYFSWSQG